MGRHIAGVLHSQPNHNHQEYEVGEYVKEFLESLNGLKDFIVL